MRVAVAAQTLVEGTPRRARLFTVDEFYQLAEAGIAEYWVLDLAGERLRVFRQPDAGEFTETLIARRGQSLEPRRTPALSVNVDSLVG